MRWPRFVATSFDFGLKHQSQLILIWINLLGFGTKLRPLEVRHQLFQPDIGEFDLIVFAFAVLFQPIPTSSAILMGNLGIADRMIETFDINTTCLSFLCAIDKVGKMMRGGAYEKALIVSSEVASRTLP